MNIKTYTGKISDAYNNTMTELDLAKQELPKIKLFTDPYDFRGFVKDTKEIYKQVTALRKEVNSSTNNSIIKYFAPLK